MAEKLNGRLEVVKIEKPLFTIDNCNYGGLLRDERRVTVRNAIAYEGHPCLVRFDLRDGLHRPEPEGYFISSVVPPSFEGLAPEQYVLVGLWDQAHSLADIPTLHEIEQVYRPSNMPLLYYFQRGFSQKRGKYIINNQKITFEPRSSLSSCIRDVNPQHAVRVFVVESEIDLEKMIVITKNQNLHPIIMEPLKKL